MPDGWLDLLDQDIRQVRFPDGMTAAEVLDLLLSADGGR